MVSFVLLEKIYMYINIIFKNAITRFATFAARKMKDPRNEFNRLHSREFETIRASVSIITVMISLH